MSALQLQRATLDMDDFPKSAPCHPFSWRTGLDWVALWAVHFVLVEPLDDLSQDEHMGRVATILETQVRTVGLINAVLFHARGACPLGRWTHWSPTPNEYNKHIAILKLEVVRTEAVRSPVDLRRFATRLRSYSSHLVCTPHILTADACSATLW